MPGAFTERSRHFFNSDNSVFNMTEINSDLFERMTIAATNDTWLKKENMEDQIISKAPELDESEIKALIENFDTIGILLKEHITFLSNPIVTSESKKMCNEGLVLIKKFTQKCLEHYGMRYLSK
ncbi:hypothetical protein SAMN05421821_103468 [Mucilaginibacter lappiensis]|nr:hypothetical protein SAMN05421821_103468 [Mucilaginibacter lappiensis]